MIDLALIVVRKGDSFSVPYIGKDWGKLDQELGKLVKDQTIDEVLPVYGPRPKFVYTPKADKERIENDAKAASEREAKIAEQAKADKEKRIKDLEAELKSLK